MVTEDEKRRAEKRARSEAKRLESFQEKRQLEKSRKDIVAEALRKVDSTTPSSKRIVFDSDDEEPSSSSNGVKKEIKKDKPKTSTSTSKLTLFDEDEEGDEGEETELIRNRHTGEKGAKLMAMEARFNNDPRFRLNEDFVDEDEKSEDGEETEMKEEKKAEREVLARILGKTSLESSETKKNRSGTNKSLARPFTRFDPENPEHVRWVQEHAKTDKDSKSREERKTEGEGEEKEDDVPTAPGHFFSMNENFAKELKKKLEKDANQGDKDESGGFSFLELMGRKAIEVKEEAVEVCFLTAFRSVQEKETVEEPQQKRARTSSESGLIKRTLNTSTLPFFITGDEPQIRSVVANFKRTQTLEKTTASWKKSVGSIIKIYQHQRRMAVKEQKEAEKFSFGRGGAARRGRNAKRNGPARN